MGYFHLTRFDNDGGVVSPIHQGASFQIVFHYFGDVSNYLARGQVRSDFASNGGSLLAEFEFDPLAYQLITKKDSSQCMATVIVAKLPASVTNTMPIPTLRKTIKDKNVVGIHVWVYDIELESPDGFVIRLIEGYVEVLPQVTS